MNWFGAMICLLPLLALASPVKLLGVHIPWGPKGRTWLAMLGASIAAWIFGPQLTNPVPMYALIDALAAWVVLTQPIKEFQRAIGLLFIGMLTVDIGYAGASWLQHGPHDFNGYVRFNSLIGWLQWACLASWGVGDAMAGIFVHGRGRVCDPLSAEDGL